MISHLLFIIFYLFTKMIVYSLHTFLGPYFHIGMYPWQIKHIIICLINVVRACWWSVMSACNDNICPKSECWPGQRSAILSGTALSQIVRDSAQLYCFTRHFPVQRGCTSVPLTIFSAKDSSELDSTQRWVWLNTKIEVFDPALLRTTLRQIPTWRATQFHSFTGWME